MPQCKKCQINFPISIVIDNKKRNLCKRKYCLECSPWGLHNTRKLHFIDLEAERTEDGIRSICKSCNREYTYRRGLGHTKSECNSCKTNKQRYDKKIRAIEYKGGKCQRCGYSKCRAALHFHHRDPSKKEFSVGGNHCYSWNRIKGELDKCDLICSNCHAEIHEKWTLGGRLLKLTYNQSR